MRAIRIFCSLGLAVALWPCGTLEDNSWATGVPRKEALEIRSALIAQKHAHKVYRYQRQDDGSVIVLTEVGDFKMTRLHGKMVFMPVGFVGAATH
jgi:hypothetical protein